MNNFRQIPQEQQKMAGTLSSGEQESSASKNAASKNAASKEDALNEGGQQSLFARRLEEHQRRWMLLEKKKHELAKRRKLSAAYEQARKQVILERSVQEILGISLFPGGAARVQ